MFFTMMSAFAELEANLLSERTKKVWKLQDQEADKVEDLHYLIIKNVRLNFCIMNRNSQVKKLRKRLVLVEALFIELSKKILNNY